MIRAASTSASNATMGVPNQMNSYLRMLPCLVCAHPVEIDTSMDEEFQYDAEGGGPFCENCWRWQGQINKLLLRVAELEKARPLKTLPNPRPARDVRGNPKGSRGPGCPHRPKYRHCWCK